MTRVFAVVFVLHVLRVDFAPALWASFCFRFFDLEGGKPTVSICFREKAEVKVLSELTLSLPFGHHNMRS